MAQRDALHVFGSCQSGTSNLKTDYNTQRPHSRIGWLTPAEYARCNFNPRRSDPALRSSHQLRAGHRRSHQYQKTEKPTARANSKLDNIKGEISRVQ